MECGVQVRCEAAWILRGGDLHDHCKAPFAQSVEDRIRKAKSSGVVQVDTLRGHEFVDEPIEIRVHDLGWHSGCRRPRWFGTRGALGSRRLAC